MPEDDPLYSYVSHISQMSDESLDQWQSELQNMNSIPSWDKFGVMGRLMGYAMKGKWQFSLFIFSMAINVFARISFDNNILSDLATLDCLSNVATKK